MKPIRCLIVDDEPLARRVVANYANSLSYLEIVGSCGSAMEALAILPDREVDVVFLDIEMPKLSGLSLLRSLQKPPLVVFTTAHEDHALESYELEAVDYLRKPFSFERFTRAIERLRRRLGSEFGEADAGMGEAPAGESLASAPEGKALPLFVKTDGRTVRVELEEILLVEAMGDYVKLHLEGRSIVNKRSLKEWEDMLPGHDFMRVHKSFIISLRQIRFIKDGQIGLPQLRVPIGRTFSEAVNERIDVK